MGFLDNLLIGFSISLTQTNLLYCFIGVFLGTVIGVLPGLGPTATIAILLPVTFKLDITSAIIMLSGIYYGSQYGGTITSVLVNIPGEAASVVTCFDGYQMARKGRAGAALGIAAFGSFIGGTFGIIGLSTLTFLSSIALLVGPLEYSALMFLGCSLVIYFSSKSLLKGLMMGVLGFLLSTIGMDSITAVERFTFGSLSLIEGINVAILAMGLFGIGEVLYLAEKEKERERADILNVSTSFFSLLPNRRDWKDSSLPIARGSLLGFLLGILPGGGAVISSFISYGMEKRISKNPEKFGKGAIEGVAGPETANNAASQGAFIPLLLLGIPPNVVAALILAAFMIHGVTPGPLFLIEKPNLFWGIVTSMYIGNIMLLILNVPLIKVFVQILLVPYSVLSPLILLFCFIGAYSINNNPMDVLILAIFGIAGYLMRKFQFEPGPLMLTFVIGPIFEKSLRQAILIGSANPQIFISRPIAIIFFAIAMYLYLSPLIRYFIRKHKVKAAI